MTRKIPVLPVDSPLVTVREVCALLRIGESVLIELRKRDPDFPRPRRVGAQKLMYMRAEILGYIEALPRVGEPKPSALRVQAAKKRAKTALATAEA